MRFLVRFDWASHSVSFSAMDRRARDVYHQIVAPWIAQLDAPHKISPEDLRILGARLHRHLGEARDGQHGLDHVFLFEPQESIEVDVEWPAHQFVPPPTHRWEFR